MSRQPIEEEFFDIWFKHHLRMLKMTPEQYAVHIGETLEHIYAVIDRDQHPSHKIIKEMNLYVADQCCEKQITVTDKRKLYIPRPSIGDPKIDEDFLI